MRIRYLAALQSALDRAGVPYGYTITIWTSGQLLADERGTPPVWLLPAFAAGAVVAYGLLAVLVGRWSGEPPPEGAPERLARATVIQIVAIALAIGAVALVGETPDAVAWPAAGFAATAVYLTGIALALAIG
ncbi:MAG TPA: hypothetical protein VFM58_08430 [Solirubrobacteraceae bacterium]|nr:hypothetical protein [Solirubrobacteraceae bacterium]